MKSKLQHNIFITIEQFPDAPGQWDYKVSMGVEYNVSGSAKSFQTATRKVWANVLYLRGVIRRENKTARRLELHKTKGDLCDASTGPDDRTASSYRSQRKKRRKSVA